MSRRKPGNNLEGQLFIDFDNPINANDTVGNDAFIAHQANPFVFPKKVNGLSIIDTLASCVVEIHEFLSNCPETLNMLIFKCYFVLGMATKEIETMNVPNVRIPTRERIRQIADDIATALGSGNKCTKLHGVRLSETVVEELRKIKASECGMYIDSTVLKDENLCRLQGIASIMSMRIVEAGTVLPLMTNRFLLSEDKTVEEFRSYFKMIVLIMQEEVRPLPEEQIKIALAEKLNKDEVDVDLADLILKDRSIFNVYEGDDGLTYCSLRFEHLKLYQQLARIIFEKKSISTIDIAEEMRARGSESKAMSMTQTHKKFPWCIPMGKTRWIYKEDEQNIERIQDVIKDYCEQHIRFTFDEILEYLSSRQYDMIEDSIRSYVMKYCRRKNADGNSFCLTSMVPQEEDKLWSKKRKPTTRKREIAYHKELLEQAEKIITDSPCGYVSRKTLKKQVAHILKENKVNIVNFYKILRASDRITQTEIDGEVCVALVE